MKPQPDQSDIVERILALPKASLKRRKSYRGKSRGPYKVVPRPLRSRSELVAYIRDRGFRTRSQLRSGRDHTDPTCNDYVKEFGSFLDAMKLIWRESYRATIDRRYVIQSVVEFGLWDMVAYQKARSRRPDILPSVYAIQKDFGSWAVMKEAAQAFSLRESLAAYAELKHKLGKRPTLEDCRKARVEIGTALKLWGKRGLDDLVSSMEEVI